MLTRLQIQDNIDALEEQGASQQEIQEWLDSLPKQSEAPAEPPKKDGILKTLGKALISSELKFGKSIADSLPGFVPGSARWTIKQNEEIMKGQMESMDNLLVQRKKLKAEGKDTSRIDKLIQQMQQDMSKPAIDVNETNPSINKSAKQIFGEGLGVAADIASFGTYGNAAKGTQTGKLLLTGKASKAVAKVLPVGTSVFQKTVPTATTKLAAFGKGFVEGAKTAVPVGATYGAASSMQADEDLPTIVKKALGSGAISGIIGGTLTGLANMKNVAPEKLKEEAIESYKRGLNATKEKYKEQTEKIIPDLLDEGAWGTHKKLLKKAERGIALSKEEYAKLGELQGSIETDGLLQKIDDEIANYSRGGRAFSEKSNAVKSTINNHLKTATQILDDPDMTKSVAKADGVPAVIKDAQKNIVDQLRHNGLNEIGDLVDNMDISKMDSVDEFGRTLSQIVDDALPQQPISVNSSKINQLKKLRDDIQSLHLYNKPTEAYQQDLRELAQDYGDVVYETRKSIKTVDDNSTLSQVRKIDGAIRDLLNTKNPEYEKINKIYSLNSRLFDILDETAKRKEARPLISWFNAIMGSTGATIGGTAGSTAGPAGSAVGSIAGGSLAVGLTTALNSTWFNTLRAVQKNQLAEKLMEIGSLEAAKYWVRVLNSQGTKAVNEILSSEKEKLNQVPQ